MNQTQQSNLKGGLDRLLHQAGVQLDKSSAEIATYAAKRADDLLLAVGQPGYFEAVEAAADDVLLFAGGSAVRAAAGYDRELRGYLRGALLLAVGG